MKNRFMFHLKHIKIINLSQYFKAVFQDTLATTKFKCAGTLFELIAANPCEQSRVILEALINKLGDPDYKVAARIIYDIKNYCK